MATTRSYCRFCGALCGILVETDGDRVLSVKGDADHLLSRGYTCPKGRALPAFHHHPDRLDGPLLRGQPASWDEVLGDLAAGVADIVAGSGPDAVASFVGTGSAFDVNGRRLAERFIQALPSRSRYSTATVDNASKPLVAEYMAGHPGLIPAVDHQSATLVLLFGTNPVVSHGHLNAFPDPVVRLRALAARGELWVVDPRRHETARLATRHLAIRPGTDYALLAYLVRSLLGDGGGADRAYLEAHARPEDIDRLRAAVEPFDRETAAARCGLAEDDLDDLLAAIRRHGKVAGQTGTGVTMSPAANAAEWLMWALHIVTGSYDAPGGMWFNPGYMKGFDRRPLRSSDGAPAPGPDSRPELPGRFGELPCAALADEIEAGNVKALFVVGGNPLTALAQPERLAAAFATLDVLVVADVVRTEVTDLATHVFACAGQLERADLPGLADTFQVAMAAQYTPAVVPPAADRRPMWWPFAELSRRLGMDDLLPKGLTPDTCTDDDLLAIMADRSASSWAELKAAQGVLVASEGSFGWVRRNLLPDGRWRLAPEPLVAELEALVDYEPPALVLIPRRQLRHMNAQLRDGAAGAVRADAPDILLHPRDAEQAQVRSGDRITVSSANGSVTGVALVSPDLLPGTLSIPHGFDRPNVSRLTGTADADLLSGMTRQSGIPVTVAAAEAAPEG